MPQADVVHTMSLWTETFLKFNTCFKKNVRAVLIIDFFVALQLAICSAAPIAIAHVTKSTLVSSVKFNHQFNCLYAYKNTRIHSEAENSF